MSLQGTPQKHQSYEGTYKATHGKKQRHVERVQTTGYNVVCARMGQLLQAGGYEIVADTD
jgi:hypothetical protein